jgi:putative membrane protein
MRWRRALKQNQVPMLDPQRRRTMRMILHVQLLLLFAIILLAVMMARGIGFLG